MGNPVIRRGSTGSDVAIWQGIVGALPDGDFGARTEELTKAWQSVHGLESDGIVGPASWAAAQGAPTVPPPPLPPGLAGIPLIQARHFTRHAGQRKIDLIVVHTMECAEKPGTARAVASWFASDSAPEASAHFCVDSKEVIQCVSEDDLAWHAGRVNGCSIGIEHAGRASQTAADWDDAYSRAMLVLSARLAAALCSRHGVPVVRLSPNDVFAGARGFCGHVDITKAYKVPGGHTDPGPAFPWTSYLDAVAHALEALRPPDPAA